MRNTILLFTVVLCFVGCSNSDDTSGVNIRVKNVSNIDFDKAQVGDENHVHTDLAANDFSEYLAYEMAYEYAYIKINSGSENFVLQPIDFVGETPLKSGFYTYELDVSEDDNVLLNFVRD